MTLYEAWSRGHKWVVYRGFLCKVSAKPSTRFWLAHLGWWGHPRSRFYCLVDGNAVCDPCPPNTPRFKRLYREN